jgi:two-component system NtrC family sensor kinase
VDELVLQADRDLQKIVSAALYAREVIKKLLVFARQMPPRVHPVNLNRVIEESMYFLEGRCARGSIRVERDLARRLPDIEADASQLSQVVVNLVVNAIQAMEEGGTLTLSTLVQEEYVMLVVGDTGHGMTKDVRDKIFLPFFSTKDVDEGTGLGLAVVHGIVNAHNGSINVETRPGHGSRFEVRLPIHDTSRRSETMDDG